MVCSWPSLVVFDLDHTLINRPRFRTGPPFAPVDGGLGGVQSACGARLDLFPAARRALVTLADAGVSTAIVSRTHRPVWARDWLSTLRIDAHRTVSDAVDPLVVMRDGSKR